MADTQASCPHCGAELEAGSKFCAACGRFADADETSPTQEMATTAQPAAEPPKQPNLARTMLGVNAAQVAAGARPATAGAPKQRAATPPRGLFATQTFDVAEGGAASPAGTAASGVFSGPAAVGATTVAGTGPEQPAAATSESPSRPEGPPDPAAAGSDASAAAAAAAASRPRRSLAKTMLGISPESALGLQRAVAEAEAQQRKSAAAAEHTAPAPEVLPQAAPRPNAKPMARTIMGLANPMAAAPPPGSEPQPSPKETLQGVAPVPTGMQVPADGPPRPAERSAMARTMLGIPPAGLAAQPAGAPAAASPAGAPPGGGRTMLGVAQPGAERPGPAASLPAVPAVVTNPPNRPYIPAKEAARETRVTRPQREMRRLWPIVGVTVVVVAATLYLLARPSSKPEVEVSAKIVSSETGEALLFEVPSAPEGSKIRFGGQEKPIQAGRASFALAADSLRVGDNLVLAEVVRPESEPAPVRLTLAVYHRIWVDTAALRGDRSALDVVVTALPGTRVTLDAEELELDAAGRGVRSYPIDVVSEAKSGVIEHVVRYRVQPPSGETVVDELRTRIPVAMMQIDRPGREVLTDRDSIEIAGAVGKDTLVHVDKTAVPVKDGRFLYRLALPQPGEYSPRIVASSPGKVPLGVTLAIERVKDLRQAAAQFAATPDLNYAKLAPNPVIYKGQKIALEGRVYAIDPRGADSVIQMLVRPCPSSRRCPLWVSDPHATEVAVDSWVRVLGTVQGEQQFRSEKNEIVTVPKVEASFVLPASP